MSDHLEALVAAAIGVAGANEALETLVIPEGLRTNGGPFVHAVQGGYFYKSFGKHGPLHNLFAYHYFPQQECDQAPGGPPTGGTIYNGGAFPSQLTGTFIAGNFLGHTVSWWNLTPNGSTVRATYGGELFNTHDAWSGPTPARRGSRG